MSLSLSGIHSGTVMSFPLSDAPSDPLRARSTDATRMRRDARNSASGTRRLSGRVISRASSSGAASILARLENEAALLGAQCARLRRFQPFFASSFQFCTDLAQCKGRKQSPLDLRSADATLSRFPAFEFRGWDEEMMNKTLKNGGHDAFVLGSCLNAE